jgi:site-specific DNA-methyltransferase (adenine-specific)
MSFAPGTVRDAIIGYLEAIGQDASIAEIYDAVVRRIGDVPPSSVRSYLNLNSQEIFERTDVGRYRLKLGSLALEEQSSIATSFLNGSAQLLQTDCFQWLAQQKPCSIEAVVTDPPYGLVEYTPREQTKLRNGKGGIWRIPPSFDGHKRSPLPRFTVLDDRDRQELHFFFRHLAILLARVSVPGANVVVASNPLLSHIVASAMVEGGLELRGNLVRLVMTMRGGDRPKNAHQEFSSVSVMPRSMWEPWIVLRKPLEGRVQDNLRKWKTGGFRRPSPDRPFGDVIKAGPAAASERKLAPHPSLKPQAFLRQLVRGVLPLGEGIVLDPFAGAGSTLAAANAVGYASTGLEIDPHYFRMAAKAIPHLSHLMV